jgi:hypothetical protein
MTTIEDMYKNFAILADAKDKAGEHVEAYKAIMTGTAGGSNEKRLASQFIARFFKYFPALFDRSLDAMMDLCEDTDVNIRKQAVKDMPALCRDNPALCQRIADVLTQLMQTDDSSELSLINISLVTLLKTNAKGSLSGIFDQILHGDELIRERAITFVASKVRMLLSEEVLSKDAEEELVTLCKKVLEDVTAVEFMTFMRILMSLPSMNTLLGRQQLLDIVTEQADLASKYDVTDSDSTDRLIQCVKQALPLFSKNVHSTRFVEFICLQVLPVLPDAGSSAVQLELLKQLAEMVTFCGEMESAANCVANIYTRLLDCMPLPQSDDLALGIDASSGSDSAAVTTTPKLQFSCVECLMFTFHHLARRCPQFLTADENAERLRDFRVRLQYFARGVQVYIKQLRTALQGATPETLKTEENKIKSLALKTTTNINSLIKDLFYNPPAYKAVITLSWKSDEPKKPATSEATAGQKRSAITPVKFDSETVKKAAKNDQKMYTPPGGKFSEKAGTYQGPARGGQYGGQWRGTRGRGGGAWGRGGGGGYRRY